MSIGYISFLIIYLFFFFILLLQLVLSSLKVCNIFEHTLTIPIASVAFICLLLDKLAVLAYVLLVIVISAFAVYFFFTRKRFFFFSNVNASSHNKIISLISEQPPYIKCSYKKAEKALVIERVSVHDANILLKSLNNLVKANGHVNWGLKVIELIFILFCMSIPFLF